MRYYLDSLDSVDERIERNEIISRFLAVFAVKLKRIAVSGLKLDEKSIGDSPRVLKCLILLQFVNKAKIGPRRPVFLPVFYRCKRK